MLAFGDAGGVPQETLQDVSALAAMGIIVVVCAAIFIISSPCGPPSLISFRKQRRSRRHRYRRGKCPCCSGKFTEASIPAPLPLRPRQRRTAVKSNLENTTTQEHNSPRNDAATMNLSGAQSKRSTTCTSSLMDLARMQDWDNVAMRCTTHRREARHRDADQLLPLHWACSGGPPAFAIRALLEAYPRSARRVDSEGSTALHFACHYGARSTDVLQILIDAYPEAIRRRDVYGRTPLYHAVAKGARIDALELLLRQDATVATLPCLPQNQRDNKAPKDNAFNITRHSKSFKNPHVPPRTPLSIAWNDVLTSPRSSRRRAGKKWDKAVLLLKAAFMATFGSGFVPSEGKSPTDGYCIEGENRQPYKFRMLHAALALNSLLPFKVMEIAIETYPEQARERDDLLRGRLPLAVACSTEFCDTAVLCQVIDALLKLYPRAASVSDNDGRLPLALALESHKTWKGGVRQLLYAHPALSRDSLTYLYPFQLAAASAPVPTEATELNTRNAINFSCACNAVSSEIEATEKVPTRNDVESKHPEVDLVQKEQMCKQGVGYGGTTCTEHTSLVYELLIRFPNSIAVHK